MPGEKRAKVVGKSRWKVWTPHAALRAGFAAPESTFRSTALQLRGSHRHAQQLQETTAMCLYSLQKHVLMKLASPEVRHNYLIGDLMWDETIFTVTATDFGEKQHQILAMAGGVAWSENEQARETSIILRVHVLKETTAAVFSSALKKHLAMLCPIVRRGAAFYLVA